MIGALFLLACAGDWEGSFDASTAVTPWPARLIDVEDVGPTTEEEHGRVGWREWRGTFELQADEVHWVAPMKAYVCDEDTCEAEDTSFVRGDLWMLADLNAGTFRCECALEGDTITGQGWRILDVPAMGPVTFTRTDRRLRVGDL